MAEKKESYNDIFLLKLDQLLEYNKRQDERIGTIHTIITGNGNPERGLIVKHARLEEKTESKLESIARTLKQHWGILIGTAMTVIGAVIKIAFF